MNRGLQVVNYFLVATAVLATAYVSAINGKHYSIAAVLALFGTALTAVTFAVGLRQRARTGPASDMVLELRERVARRLNIEPATAATPQLGARPGRFAVPVAFGLVLVLNVGSLLHAVTR